MISLKATDGLAGTLYAAEASLDEAVTGAAALIAAMVETRAACGLPATIGAGAQTKAAEALTTLSAARRALANAHAELAKLADTHAVVLTGPVPKPEEDKKPPRVVEPGPRRAA